MMVYKYTVEKKENQSQMFNRNNHKMMMVEICEKNKRDDGLETVVYLFLWKTEFCDFNIATYCPLMSLSSVR